MTPAAQRPADDGCAVLPPDIFYRYGPYGRFVPNEVFAGDVRAIPGPLIATTGNDKATEDTVALLAYLDTRNDVAGRRIGTVGFCMGGGMALAAAEAYSSAHGWMKPDFPVYDHFAAECGWAEMLALFARNLRHWG